jgi:AraC-like DNA-binding protein
VLKEVGLTRVQVSDPDERIPFHKHTALMEVAARLTGDRCFGMRLGMTIHPKQAGALGFMALSSTTLGDALRNFARYLHVLTEGAELEIELRGDHAALIGLIVDPRASDKLQAREFGIAGLLSICRAITGEEVTPRCVEFRHGKPRDTSEHERTFGAPVRFGRERNALVLRREVLELPIETADSALLKALTRCSREAVGEREPARDLAHRVRELVASRLPAGDPAMDGVARELGMSARTLARRLEEVGASYRELVEDLRHRLARRYLREEQMRMGQIAYMLGYSDVTAFNHAFRRWTGSAPSEYRARLVH